MTAPFALFWHRCGNTADGLERVLQAASPALAGRSVVQGVELDLKWAGDPPLLYAYHGPTGRERLTRSAAERWAARGRVLPIETLFAHPRAAELHYLIELKCGRGSPRAALQALSRRVDERGLAERVWLASSSLDLLSLAQQVAPALSRVLFAAPHGRDRVWHKPTTHTIRSLRDHGVRPQLPDGLVQWLCPIGLRPRTPDQHAELAAAAQARGLGYLPGRVTTHSTLQAMAQAGYPGAFVYAKPGSLQNPPSLSR